MMTGKCYPQITNIKKRILEFPVAFFSICSLVFFGFTAQAQTYYNVTNLSGTSSVGGINVTVTSSGVASSFVCTGSSQPYLEGQDLGTLTYGLGSYTWSFSSPVNAIRIHMESIDAIDNVTIYVNGAPYALSAGNITALPSGSTCLGSAGMPTITGSGTLMGSGGSSTSATIDIMPGSLINSVTVESALGGNGVLNDMMFSQNADPAFVNTGVQLFSICESSGSNNIDTMLAVSDADAGQTLTWSVVTAPMHGTLGGFPMSATSTGGTVIPSGLSYTPTPGFSGFDTFYVQVSDGITTATSTLVVTVKPKPTLSSPLTIPAICSGALLSYVPTSPVAGTTFNWTRNFVGGVSNPTASGTGNPNEILYNISYYNVAITYVYSMTADGCSNIQTVNATVKPIPVLSSPLNDTLCNGDTLNYIPVSPTAGTTFTWSRPSVSGITPASSSGTGTIHEQLMNTTSSPINVVYSLSLDAYGCTSLASVTVTVNPPISGTPITTMPPSTLCEGTIYQNFGTSVVPPAGTVYTWSAVNATIIGVGNGGQYALVSFNIPGTAVITLNGSVLGSSCLTSDSYTVTVDPAENTSAHIIYTDGQFVYLDNTASTYQWGYDEAVTLDSTAIAGAQFQSYPNSSPDFTNKYYWVITTKNGCMQKTYYNAPPLAVQNISASATLKIFPNPSNGNITVETGVQGTVEISFVNMIGQTTKTISGNSTKLQVNATDMPSGCYIVNCIQNGIKIATTRFIKN